jgi:hypothetical protein
MQPVEADMLSWLIRTASLVISCGVAALATAPAPLAIRGPAGDATGRTLPVVTGRTRHVVLIVADGLRWQEIFSGADSSLMNESTGGFWHDPVAMRRQYWRPDASVRRALLFPFLWGTVATHGQLIGNQIKHSIARVTNGLAFSYPGYNEMLVGYPDPRVNSNEFGINPNQTVFEWLNRQADLTGQIAVFATWKTFTDIFNEPRSHLDMHVGWAEPYSGTTTPRQALLNELYRTTARFDDDDVYDAFMQIPLLDYVRDHAPRALFVGYGETDNWAHAGRYDLVLESAHAFDQHLARLWSTLQAIPEYRDRTTFIITTDHGRGSGPVDWKEHGVDQKGSDNIWLAVLGPDTPALGERADIAPVTQSQIAATVAALIGKDYRRDVPAAAPALAGVLSPAPGGAGSR